MANKVGWKYMKIPIKNMQFSMAVEANDTIIRDASMMGVCPGVVDSNVRISETLSRVVFPDKLNTRIWDVENVPASATLYYGGNW